MNLKIAIGLMLVLECLVTIATAYQHHSEARWEISATYFGTVPGYILSRLVIWIPLAFIFLSLAKLRHRFLVIWQLLLVGIALEITTTLGSILLRDKEPAYGIFYGSFLHYLIARALFLVPLSIMLLIFANWWYLLQRRD